MKPADLAKFSEPVRSFAVERDWDQFHSIKNLVMAMSVEMAELVEIFQWSTEAQSNALRDDPKKLAQVESELADIAIYFVRILQKTDIGLEAAIARKLQHNAEKYPVSLAKGSAKKYTELK